MSPHPTYTAFAGDARLGRGPLADLIPIVLAARDRAPLVFADATGDLLKLGTDQEVAEALAPPPPPVSAPVELAVRLLPRHRDWLQEQPGGASAAIRRLVDAARREGAGRPRQARDSAYRFISMVAGDREGFSDAMTGWPDDLRDYAIGLGKDGLG